MTKYIAGVVCVIGLIAVIFMSERSLKTSLAEAASADTMHCSEGWRLTGYFTPIENDYTSTEMTELDVAGVGRVSLNAEFVRVVFDEGKGFGEGWGKTRFGWYLGNYDGAWHRSPEPLDAHNSPLQPNSVAVDNSLIPDGSTVIIPRILGSEKLIADDVGVTVHGKHIDIYTGEGQAARREMYHVTFEDDDELQEVCFQAPEKGKKP
jgi:3D (Asp-Asp-Asp) domain-containing protein